MPQYDLLLTQNVAPAGVEFSEKYVNIAKGGILSAIADGTPTVLPAGANGFQLIRDDAEVTGLKWVAVSGGHTQGTDIGTTNADFTVNSGSATGKLRVLGVGRHKPYSNIANTVTTQPVTLTLPNETGILATQSYAQGLFAANDAMVYKGTIGTAGTHTIAAFNALATYNAGWTYRVIEAGTVRGVSVEVGDLVTVVVTRAGSGNANSDFTVVQTNLDGAVIGPASTTDNFVALFSGTTGKLLKAGSGALGTAAYSATGDYATSAQGTLATNAIPKGTITGADQIVYGTGASNPAALSVTASTFVGRKAAGNLSAMSVSEASTLLGLGTMAAETATDYVAKVLFDAQTILAATSDNTPAALNS